ncbi:hypothetical protein J6895_02799 [Nakaseomyces glabratus]|nr:hypothetical protein J6895_02799 [Nakaseomyces glabratus]
MRWCPTEPPRTMTHTIDLGNGVTNYEVVSYRTTTNEYGGYITVTETVTFKAPPVTVVELKGDDYVESDWVSFFITTDEKGDIITGSTTINGTRDYLDADAPDNSLAPAPSPVTHTIDLGNGVTNYEVVSYRTTTNEYGGYITVTETVTFKAPPVTVVELKGDDYVESDWVSFFITTDEKGDIITGSTTINGTRDYLDADAPDNSLAPAPSPVTHTIDLGNGVTNYEVVSYRTTTNEYGGYITVTETVTFKAPPVTVVELKGDDYVESDWVSFFITTDEKGDIITGSTTINGTRDYLDADAPDNSLAPAPSPVTHTIDLGNGVTNYEVVSYRTTTNEYGGYITVTETVTFKAPPVTVVELKGDDYVESDWVSFFITTDEKGDIITGSTTINGTRDYLDADAPDNSLAPAPSPVTHTIDLGNGVTNYEVVSYRTTTNEYGGYITVTETVTFKAPPVTVVELKGDDYVESDWVSFFITTDEKGDIITGSTTINGTRDYLDADAPDNSLAPAPSPVTHTIDLGNGVTNYEVVSYRTTTNEYGGYITVTETVTFKAPPVTVVELKGDDYVESDWVSFFITTDEKGDIITGSTTINGTPPSPVTHTIDLGNGVTNYEVVSYRTTTNEYGGYITVTETVTFKAPPVTVVELKGDDYVESDWVSFFITTDEKGDIITGSTTINGTRDYLDADAPHNSLAPAPSPVTHTIDLGNGVTNYEVVSYRTTTNEYGGYITVTETVTFKAPPVTVVELKGDDYVESDWVSFFITTDEKGDIITGSTTINGTRDYLDADAPHNSLAPAPSPVTHTIDLGNGVTNYEVVSYRTTTNEYGGYITVTETVTFKAPPVTVVELKGDDYVESDWVSFFITTDEKGDIITGSTTINGTRDYLDADAPHNSLAPAPSPVTHTIDLGNGVTNYEVVSYRTTTNEYGGYITVTETVTFKAPPVTVVELKGDDYVESDWVSFFITTDEKGDIITGSTTINGTRDYLDADAPHNSLAPAPSPVTHTIDLGNGVTNYEVVSYRTTTNEYGGYITVTETVTFKAPPVTVVELKGDDYVESDWVSFFITTDEKGDIITGSTTINGTRDYLDADAPHNSLAPAPSPVTHTIDLGNGVTNYEVVSYRTTTNEYGGYITVTETVTFKAPPVTVVELKGDDYVESDWVSFFITTDEKGDIITGSTTINGTPPSPVTHTIDLGNGVTNYEVVSYRTTTNEYGGYITVTETVTFKAPPVTVVELKGDDYVESDWVSFFITTDEKGDIITGSTTINGTRDYLDADAPHNSLAPAPSPVTHTIDLGNGVTNYEVVSYRTTTNEYGGYITVTETVTFKAPPVTVVELKGDDYVESDWVSFFITTDEKGDIITGSTTINGTRDYLDADAPHNSLAPAPSPVTHTIDLGNGVTNYEVVSYRTTTNEYGGYITVTETVTFKAPPVTVVELKGDDYVESDWVSFFITTDEKGDIITGSTTINGTRDYLDADAPTTRWLQHLPQTTTNEYGGYITVTETVTFKAPPVTVVELKGDDYVESDWVSFFITTDEKGDIITGSTTINGTRDYLDADAPHNSLAPAPSPVTHTIDLGNGVTNYEVVSYRTTTNEYGGYITVTETVTFKAPPVTVVELKGDDYVESDWVSFFITTDEKGDIITGSTTINGTRDYLDADAPHNSLAPAPSPVTHTIDLGNGVTNYEVVSYRTTTNEYGGYITVTETVTFKAPPVTVVELKGDDYVESDWVSFFITTDEKGDIITGSTTINGTRDYLDADAPTTRWLQHLPQ